METTRRDSWFWLRSPRDWPWIVRLAAALHFGWAVILCFSDAALHTTTGDAMVGALGGRYGLIAALLFASLLAIRGRYVDWPWNVGFLLPQQGILILGALGGLEVVLEGEYADGVERPYAFILFDQLPIILLAAYHSGAVINLYPRKVKTDGP